MIKFHCFESLDEAHSPSFCPTDMTACNVRNIVEPSRGFMQYTNYRFSYIATDGERIFVEPVTITIDGSGDRTYSKPDAFTLGSMEALKYDPPVDETRWYDELSKALELPYPDFDEPFYQ